MCNFSKLAIVNDNFNLNLENLLFAIALFTYFYKGMFNAQLMIWNVEISVQNNSINQENIFHIVFSK